MIPTHQKIQSICDDYNSLFSKNEFYPIQKAYTTPHFLVLSVRFPGKNVAIYLGRGHQYQGLFLSLKLPPSFLRVQDRLLDYIRKYLVGARIGRCRFEGEVMLFEFAFKTHHSKNRWCVAYKNRQLCFARNDGEQIFLSWLGSSVPSDHWKKEVEAAQFDRPHTFHHWSIEDYLKSENEKASGSVAIKKREKFLLKKITNIKGDIEHTQKAVEILALLEADKLDLSADHLQSHGHQFKWAEHDSIWVRRDRIYEKCKRLKKATHLLEQRLSECQEELLKVKSGQLDIAATKEHALAPLWNTSTIKLKAAPSNYQVKNLLLGPILGLVGLNAISNDWIRSQAHKDHYWFHLENYRGAHCILKTDDLSRINPQELVAIASMLRDLSGLSLGEIPLVYAQVKSIKGVKGSPGEVIIKKPKYLRCVYAPWKEIISLV